jgi:hypothetical protein
VAEFVADRRRTPGVRWSITCSRRRSSAQAAVERLDDAEVTQLALLLRRA